MAPARWKIILVATVLAAAAGPQRPACADGLAKNLLFLLEDFGFQFSGNVSPIRQGFSVNIARQFNDEFDYGMVSLALSGPIAFQFETAKRFGQSAEFGISTLSQPLTYNFTINTGFQDFSAAGAVLIDSGLEINPFGFYDFDLFLSNRGTFDADGFLLVDSGTLDYDIGPVDISGNIFVDALAVLTDPFWVAINQQNPLAKLSGRATKEAAVDDLVGDVQDKVESDLALADADMQALIDATVLAAVLGFEVPDLSFLEHANLEKLTTTTTTAGRTVVFGDNPNLQLTVPEPSVVLLMVGPTILWMTKRRLRRAPRP